MAFCELHYFCGALEKQVAVNVILPEAGLKGPFPVFYLLHGRGDDYSIWMRRTSIERYAAGLPLLIVMPDGGRGFYSDAVTGFAYETAITRDLISYIDETFNTSSQRAARCIGGLSMGGYGALKLAFRFPHLFVSATSHSGATDFGQGNNAWIQPRHRAELERITGPNPKGSDFDLFALAEKADRANLPALRFDCGMEDFLIEQNRAFHQHLDIYGIPHQYEEFPGAHDWGYWDTHIQDALKFHSKHLGISS